MNEKGMTSKELKISFEGGVQSVKKDFQSIREDFNKVNKRLDKIEKDVSRLGNGKPGIGIRADCLENSQKSAKESKKNWGVWIIPLATAFLDAFFGLYFSLLDK